MLPSPGSYSVCVFSALHVYCVCALRRHSAVHRLLLAPQGFGWPPPSNTHIVVQIAVLNVEVFHEMESILGEHLRSVAFPSSSSPTSEGKKKKGKGTVID